MPTSIPVQPTITAAGLAAVFNDQSTGVEFAISHIAFGTAQYTPDGTETALQVEKVRVPIAGGGRISPTQIQIYAIAQAAAGNPFFVGEVGFFGDNGATLLAVYSSTATPNLYLSDTVSTSVSYALGLAALPANSVTVTIDPSASAALLIMGAHVAAADPHPQYVQKVNGVAFYDPTLTFNLNAQVVGDDGLVYQSAQANNIGHPPSSSPTWWVPLYNYGDTPITGLAAANVTLSSTQAARAHITLSGAITANINVVFPTWQKDWTVVNNTTGAFSVTCKTAAGTGIAVPQNGSPTKIRGDGTNITQPAENVARATQSQHATQLGQVQGSTAILGFVGINDAGSSTTLFDLNCSWVTLRNPSDGSTYTVVAPAQVQVNINTAGPVAGGRDVAAAFAASSCVRFFYIYNPTTATLSAIASNNAPTTGPALPAGYTAWAYATSVFLTSASVLSIVHCCGSWVEYAAPALVVIAGTATSQTGVSLTTSVPAEATQFELYIINLSVLSTSAGAYNATLFLQVESGKNAWQCGLQGVGAAASNTFGVSGGSKRFAAVTPGFNYLITVGAGTAQQCSINLSGYNVPNGGE